VVERADLDGRIPERFHEVDSATSGQVKTDENKVRVSIVGSRLYKLRRLTQHHQLVAKRGELRISDQS